MFANAPRWLSHSVSAYRHGLITGPAWPLPQPAVFGHVHAWHLMDIGQNQKT